MLALMCFAIGWAAARRQAAPRIEYRERVVTRTVTVTSEQAKTTTTETKAEQRQRVTHRTEVIKPNGERVITFDTASQVAARVDVRQLEALNLSSSSSSSSERTTELKQTPSSPPSWRVAALAGLSARGPVYGAEVSRRLGGPLWVGAWLLVPSPTGPVLVPAGGAMLAVEW